MLPQPSKEHQSHHFDLALRPRQSKRRRSSSPSQISPGRRYAVKQDTCVLGQGRLVTCPADLDDEEIRECFKIADAAIKAMSPQAQMTDEVLGKFISMVFQDSWQSTSDAPTTVVDKRDLLARVRVSGGPIGHAVPNGTDGPNEKLSLYYGGYMDLRRKLISHDISPLDDRELSPSVYKISFFSTAERKPCFKTTMVALWEDAVLRITKNNQDCAVKHARNMIRMRCQGAHSEWNARTVSFELYDLSQAVALFPWIAAEEHAKLAAVSMFDEEWEDLVLNPREPDLSKAMEDYLVLGKNVDENDD